MSQISKAAAALGKMGGSVSSAAKTAAVRVNGLRGGRPTPFRRVTMQRGGERIYRVPPTENWGGWRDADAVVCHGDIVALRDREGRWRAADGEPLSRGAIARYARLKSIGISTR